MPILLDLVAFLALLFGYPTAAESCAVQPDGTVICTCDAPEKWAP
jgi:hypothetical protein